VTINDWPALSNLLGQTNKRYNACTHYFGDLEAVYLKICRKVVYLGYRRFLAKNHQLRKKDKYFKGTVEHRSKPGKRDGAEVFKMVKDLKVVFGKGQGSEPVPKDASGCAPMWKKKSIFWELPYWKDLEVRHSIDVMHLTKNLCVNLLGFMGMFGKPKDTLEAREDLKRMKERDNLHPEKTDDGRHYLRPASYTLSNEEKESMFECLSNIKVQSGFSSNIKRIINVPEKKFINLKSYDCHVIMTQLLLVALREILPPHVRLATMKLCAFLNAIS
jgi:hypothetical protein